MEKKIIDGTPYPDEVVKAFCNQPGRELEPSVFDARPEADSWYWDLLVSHLESFYAGWKMGHEAGLEECPDCDNCEQKMPDEPPDYDEP